MSNHTLKSFDADIQNVRSTLTTMGQLASQQFRRAKLAFCHDQIDHVPLIETDEKLVNALHLQVDELCQLAITRHHPTAVDLRELVSALHAVHDLERIGDEAKKIGRCAIRIHGLEVRKTLPLVAIETMADQALLVLERALDAFIQHDAVLASSVSAMDIEVNRQRDALISGLKIQMSQNPNDIPTLLGLIFVVQSIERIGDHAKSLAESVIHTIEGIDIRHRKPL
ncbi:MAG: phosphate transport system regulatory protein PhoU [Betaproteobacteria bacterium]|nr:phosphate transport system regulatory protein PhoU [Betaproteobacteria bacterium]